MANDYTLIDFLIKQMVEMLMKKFGSTYDSALEVVLQSNTYTELVTKPYLQEEGSLFVCEMLSKELATRNP